MRLHTVPTSLFLLLLLQSMMAFGSNPFDGMPAGGAGHLPILPMVADGGAQGAAMLQGWGLAPQGPAAASTDFMAAAAVSGLTALALPYAQLPLALPPGAVVGPLLKSLGQLAVGRRLERYWPEEGALLLRNCCASAAWHSLLFHLLGLQHACCDYLLVLNDKHSAHAPSTIHLAGGWWGATISAFNGETGEHQLVYNAGQEDESFEWADLGLLSNTELRCVEPEWLAAAQVPAATTCSWTDQPLGVLPAPPYL